MKALWLLLLLSSAAATPQERGVTLSGIVTRQDTGEPISGARISIGTDVNAVTDREGKFMIERIPPSTYNVSVQADGYVLSRSESADPVFLESVLPGGSLFTAGTPMAQDAGRLVFGPNSRIADFHVRMVPSGTITGRILGPGGAPNPNVSVFMTRVVYRDGQKRLLPYHISTPAMTNDRGEFRIYWIPPGEYYIFAWDRMTRAVTYYPGTSDFTKAGALVVKDGTIVSQIDFVVLSGPPRSVKGKMVLPVEGTPESAMITPLPRDPGIPVGPSFTYTWGANARTPGEFTLGTLPPPLPPQAWDLFVVGTLKGMDYFGRATIPAGEGALEGVTVDLRPGVDIRGRVSFQNGTTPAVSLTSLPLDLRSATEIPFDTATRSKSSVTPLDASGAFILRSIPDGRYSFVQSLPSGMFIADVRQGERSIIDSGLTVEGGRVPEPIEVVVAGNGATLEGRLLDSKQQPASLTWVALIPEASRRHNIGLFRSMRADQNGRFSFDSVPPGNYELFAWHSVSSGAWTDTQFLQRFQRRGTAVSPKAGDRLSGISVNVIP